MINQIIRFGLLNGEIDFRPCFFKRSLKIELVIAQMREINFLIRENNIHLFLRFNREIKEKSIRDVENLKLKLQEIKSGFIKTKR